MSKLREALKNIVHHFCINCPNNGPEGCELSKDEGRFEFLCHKLKQARAALAEPLRNCEVGTAEEQEARFMKFCNSHYNINNIDGECALCPLNKKVKGECEFAWGQMPYEEVKK